MPAHHAAAALLEHVRRRHLHSLDYKGVLDVVQIDPGSVRTLCALATLERRAGHHKAARVHLRHALHLQPSNPAALQVGHGALVAHD